jgi:hypothetical protein
VELDAERALHHLEGVPAGLEDERVSRITRHEAHRSAVGVVQRRLQLEKRNDLSRPATIKMTAAGIACPP